MDVSIPCVCGLHETDTITLRDRLDFRRAVSLRNALAILYNDEPDAGFDEVLATLTDKYLLAGIERWTLEEENDKGKRLAVPLSYANIRDRLMTHFTEAMTVGDAADSLYTEAVMAPLLQRGRRSSPATPTNGSTSPKKPSSTRRPRPSKPSSITTIPTVATETTSSSLDGVSSSSPSSVSAA